MDEVFPPDERPNLTYARRMAGSRRVESRHGVELTNLDQPLFEHAGVSKRALVDYLDAISGRILP